MADPRALFDLAGPGGVRDRRERGPGTACGACSRRRRRAGGGSRAPGRAAGGVERRDRVERGPCAWPTISERDAIPTLKAAIEAPFGPPDIVVHAAGINTREAADDVTADGWDRTLALNLSAPFFLSQALVPAMKERGWGRIVNFASLQTTRAFPGGIAYGRQQGRDRPADPRHGRGLVAARDHRQRHRPGVLPDRTDRAVFARSGAARRATPTRPASVAMAGWTISTDRCCFCAPRRRAT